MENTNNSSAQPFTTVQVFCGKSSHAVDQLRALEQAGYELETVPAMSNKHVFHFTGRCNRSGASVILPDANLFDIFALITETEIGNPFLVWEPEKTKTILEKMGPLRTKYNTSGIPLTEQEHRQFESLEKELKAQRKPIIFYGKDDEWKGFMDFLDHLNAQGLARAGFKNSITRCHTPEEVISEITRRMPAQTAAMTVADYKHHTYEPGSIPIQEYPAENDSRKPTRETVAFFGSATTKNDKHIQTGYRSVEMCKRNGWSIVNGGGVYGVMGAQLSKAKELGVYLHGISAHERGGVGLSASETDPVIIKAKMSKFTACKDMIHRIEYYMEHSDAVGVLDGGVGSAEELFMLLELFRQHHKATYYQDTAGEWHPKPYVVIDEHGTWKPILDLARAKFGDDYLAPLTYVQSMEAAEAIYQAQFAQYKPKLPPQLVRNMVDDVHAKLAKEIRHFTPLDKKAGLGRSRHIKDWQGIPELITLTMTDSSATPEDMDRLCYRARIRGMGAVCVAPEHVALAKQKLAENIKYAPRGKQAKAIKVMTSLDMPGTPCHLPDIVAQVKDVQQQGPDSITVPFPQEAFTQHRYNDCIHYLKTVTASAPKVQIRVGLNTAGMAPEDIVAAALLCRHAKMRGIDCNAGSDTAMPGVEAIELLRAATGDQFLSVEASGPIHDFKQAMALIEAGANSIGTQRLTIVTKKDHVPIARMNEPFRETLPGYAQLRPASRSMGGRAV